MPIPYYILVLEDGTEIIFVDPEQFLAALKKQTSTPHHILMGHDNALGEFVPSRYFAITYTHNDFTVAEDKVALLQELLSRSLQSRDLMTVAAAAFTIRRIKQEMNK